MGQKERNKATEVVDGVVETVDVSKHPTASIEPSDLSLADIERRKSHPVRWILFMALVLLAMNRAVLVGARHRGAGRLMDGGEPEFPRSQRRGADFMDGEPSWRSPDSD